MNGNWVRTLGVGIAVVVAWTGCDPPAEECGSEGPVPGITCLAGIQTTTGETRAFRIRVPAGYEEGSPVPLVLNFPGLGEPTDLHEYSTGMSTKADDEGFIVVYPEPLDGQWRTGRFGEPEVAFVDELLDHLETILDVDTERVYAAGMSSGGALVHTLACERSDRFAAFAPVAPAIGGWDYECAPPAPVPVFFIFGEQDDIVSWPDGGLVISPVVLATDWAERNGADQFAEETGPVFDVWTWTHSVTPTGDVMLVLGHDLDHVWPTEYLSGFDATDLILEFFAQHTLS